MGGGGHIIILEILPSRTVSHSGCQKQPKIYHANKLSLALLFVFKNMIRQNCYFWSNHYFCEEEILTA